MNYSMINKSQLLTSSRFDAEYFQPKYLRIVEKIQKAPNIRLDDIALKITQGPNPVFDEDGERCLNGRSIKDYRINYENTNRVSTREFNKYKNFLVSEGDILITLKGLGSIGKIAYTFKEDKKSIFSRDVGLIRISDVKLRKFVFAFLLSKYGYSQIERAISGGTGQLTLTTTAIKNIIIPKLDKSDIATIDELVNQSEIENSNAEKLFQDALSLLNNFCKLQDLKEPAYPVVMSSALIKSSGRLDAEYFQPKYQELRDHLVKLNARPFHTVIENVQANFDPRKDPGKTFSYVELASIDPSLGLIDDSTELSGKEMPSRAKKILMDDDIIVSSVEGSLEKIALVKREQKGWIASNGFFQLRSKKITPEVLLVMAKSTILQYQFKQRCAGTILTAVPKESLGDILVPVLPIDVQKTITEFVKKSHRARFNSKSVLLRAKKKIEDLIENEQYEQI